MKQKQFLTNLELLNKLGEVWSGQGELSDGPRQPMADMIRCPHPGIPRNAKPLRVLLPGGVGRLQHLADLLVRARCQRRNLSCGGFNIRLCHNET